MKFCLVDNLRVASMEMLGMVVEDSRARKIKRESSVLGGNRCGTLP